MNWNKDKSVRLSKICVYFFMAAFVALCIGAPWLFMLLIELRSMDMHLMLPLFLTSTYSAAFPAAFALFDLRKLLGNISRGQVFIHENVSVLRRLSWYCFAAALICTLSTFYYMPFLLIACAGAFIGLILRVVKNVFAEAVRLKDENDYTI